ncbi:MAG: hypothetical protein KGQ88_00935 [Chloroflexi bacterium]|nr:hypothetical protein [Chloroflexota bacterium]
MKRIDPRAQLAWLAAIVAGALFAGAPGVAAALTLGIAVLARSGRFTRSLRLVPTVLPLAVAIGLLDAFSGDPAGGVTAGARVIALVVVAAAFAAVADGDALVDALRWLRVPFDVTFALVTGARLVPLAAADLSDLADTARLRGIDIDGAPPRRLRSWARLLVPLLVVTVRRGLRLGEAMEVRAFTADRPRTRRSRMRWRRRDLVAFGGALVYLSAVVVMVL